MYVDINDNMSLATVQKLFNDLFPFLKIEFFEPEIKSGGVYAVRRRLRNVDRKLADYKRMNVLADEFSIDPSMSVSELERLFSDLYKLNTHIFRKSGNVWLETTITDGWSLEQQNHQGELITAQMNEGR